MRRGIETRVENLERMLSTGGTKPERVSRVCGQLSSSQLKATQDWVKQGHGELAVLLEMLRPLDDSSDTKLTAGQVIEELGIAFHGSSI